MRSLYDLMDAGYDAEPLREFSRRLGHVPIIDQNSQRHHERPLDPAEQARYQQRTASERFNSRLKDEFGGRTVRVRGGAKKVMAHLMYGIIALAALGIGLAYVEGGLPVALAARPTGGVPAAASLGLPAGPAWSQ